LRYGWVVDRRSTRPVIGIDLLAPASPSGLATPAYAGTVDLASTNSIGSFPSRIAWH
jgi:hypothetical protein